MPLVHDSNSAAKANANAALAALIAAANFSAASAHLCQTIDSDVICNEINLYVTAIQKHQ